MKPGAIFSAAALAAIAALLWAATPAEEALQRHRNLGKAFYENPTTHAEAIAEFKKALDLAPNSVPEKLNYALALLRGGRSAEAFPLPAPRTASHVSKCRTVKPRAGFRP